MLVLIIARSWALALTPDRARIPTTNKYDNKCGHKKMEQTRKIPFAPELEF